MRYLLVTDRKPKGLKRFCAMCLSPIGHTYCRELTTRIIYCGVGCYLEHCYQTNVVFGGNDSEMQKLWPPHRFKLDSTPLLQYRLQEDGQGTESA